MHRALLPLLFAMCLMAATTGARGAERTLTVFAAASLTNVLQQVAAAYTGRTRIAVRFSFAGSATLARQIEAGAPADVFVSADQQWMDYLAQRRLVDVGSRTNVASNELVLIAPRDSQVALSIAPGFGLAAALGKRGRLATGDPDTVPVGRYARAALQDLGVWQAVAARLVPAESVRAALNFVARGEAALGIVYATDARGIEAVREVGRFPANSHPPVTYPAAATLRGGDAAADFVQFMRSAEARAIFDQYGFTAP